MDNLAQMVQSMVMGLRSHARVNRWREAADVLDAHGICVTRF